MTSKEIKEYKNGEFLGDFQPEILHWLKEIAYQLAAQVEQMNSIIELNNRTISQNDMILRYYGYSEQKNQILAQFNQIQKQKLHEKLEGTEDN